MKIKVINVSNPDQKLKSVFDEAYELGKETAEKVLR